MSQDNSPSKAERLCYANKPTGCLRFLGDPCRRNSPKPNIINNMASPFFRISTICSHSLPFFGCRSIIRKIRAAASAGPPRINAIPTFRGKEKSVSPPGGPRVMVRIYQQSPRAHAPWLFFRVNVSKCLILSHPHRVKGQWPGSRGPGCPGLWVVPG